MAASSTAAAVLPMASSRPIIVCDLDDTLVRTDLLYEQVLQLVKARPWMLIPLTGWFLRGKAFAKEQIAARVTTDPQTLPYRQDVLDLLKDKRAAGSYTILASASNDKLVKQIAAHCGVFDDAVGSSGEVNLKGQSKLEYIQQRFKDSTFEYIGDSTADLPLWEKSAKAILVNPTAAIEARVRTFGVPTATIIDRQPLLPQIIKQIRMHQWVKNALLFVPIIAAHNFLDPVAWLKTTLGFVAFSLIASLVYVMNDIVDITNDRKHPTKRRRPFAAGTLPLKVGFILAPALFATSVAISAFLGTRFLGVIGGYLALNVLYSTRFKEAVMLDVIVLTFFYTVRLLAGSAATDTPISDWLLSFSTFFFLGLAMVKRYTELLRVASGPSAKLHGRSYQSEDRLPVFMMGVGCSFISVLVLILYFASPTVRSLYSNAQNLWMLVPALLYWNGRLWILTYRGSVDDDPVVFAARDRISWLVFGLCAAIVGLESIF